jgi:small subunit ribosomal protein S6
LVISPDVGDEGFPNTVERVSSFIKDRGGDIKDVDQWGRRRLAYPIRRATEGFYSVTLRQEDAGTPPPPRRGSRIGEEALEAAGEEPGGPPADSPLSPREEAIADADQEESVVAPDEEAPVADEAGPEPEWSPATDPDTEPDPSAEDKEE